MIDHAREAAVAKYEIPGSLGTRRYPSVSEILKFAGLNTAGEIANQRAASGRRFRFAYS